MKTLMIITGALGTGGLERITCYIANKFCEKNWRVVVLTLLQKESSERSFQQLNSSVKVMPFVGAKDPAAHKFSSVFVWRKMIKKALREYKPDSILAMTFKIASLVCLFAPKYSSKVTIREISDPKSKVRNRFVNFLTECFCKNVKNIIFQTNHEKSCYHKHIREKGYVIPNPLSIHVNNKGSFCEPKMFTLSRLLLNQKRQDVLIKGFELFWENHSDYSLEIYGRGEDRERILKLIEKSKCPNSISVVDPIPDVHSRIMNYRCFVMTSDFEGMSNALLECYSLGIPCVSSDWPGVEDVITNRFDGLVYERQNHVELANLLSEIADNNHLCEEITQNAIANSSKFDESSVIEKYCEVIEQ